MPERQTIPPSLQLHTAMGALCCKLSATIPDEPSLEEPSCSYPAEDHLVAITAV